MEQKATFVSGMVFEVVFFFPLTMDTAACRVKRFMRSAAVSLLAAFSSVFWFVAHKLMLLLNFTSTVQTPQRPKIQQEGQHLCGLDHRYPAHT